MLYATTHPDKGVVAPAAAELLGFVTRDAAVASGLDDRIGTITEGKQADFIIVNLDALNLYSAADPVDAIVAAATPANVELVMVGGVVVKNGSSTYAGLDDVMRQARASRARVMRA
ncbi:amidohydrolase family protein [Mycolicibacterium sp. CBM1]